MVSSRVVTAARSGAVLGLAWFCARLSNYWRQTFLRIGNAFEGTNTAVRAVQQSLNIQGGLNRL